jgi:uncharacterized membrane protein YdbT with pleckstrin-like domain
MGIPKSSLTEDERIILEFHPHWSTLLKPISWFLLVVIVAVVAIWFIPHGSSQLMIRGIVAAAGVVAILAVCLVPYLRWRTTEYTLTNRRFVMRQGILKRWGRDIPLARVNDVSFRHNFIHRLMGAGTLVVESAGEHGQMVLDDIPHVERVQAELYQMVEQFADGPGPWNQGAQPPENMSRS